MENLFVVLTNNSNRAEIDSSKLSWLENENYVLLSDTTIPELNAVGFSKDDGVSHKINHRLYDFFRYHKDLYEEYEWVTFLDDTSYVFKNNIKKELEKRKGSRIAIMIGNDAITRCDFFNNNHIWGSEKKGLIFNLKTGISINRMFVKKTIGLFDDFTKEDKSNFLTETILDDMFFHVLSNKIESREHVALGRIYINSCEDIEENFGYYSVISGLNAIDKTIIMENAR